VRKLRTTVRAPDNREAEADGGDLDHQLALTRLRPRRILDTQYLGSAVLTENDSSHTFTRKRSTLEHVRHPGQTI